VSSLEFFDLLPDVGWHVLHQVAVDLLLDVHPVGELADDRLELVAELHRAEFEPGSKVLYLQRIGVHLKLVIRTTSLSRSDEGLEGVTESRVLRHKRRVR